MESNDVMTELARLPERIAATSCFGDPITSGDRTVIPVATVSYGFGFGSGGGQSHEGETGNGAGGGGGARTRGIGAIEVSPDGVRVHTLRDETRIAMAGIALAFVATIIIARTLVKLVRG